MIMAFNQALSYLHCAFLMLSDKGRKWGVTYDYVLQTKPKKSLFLPLGKPTDMSLSPDSCLCHGNVLSSVVSWNTKISNDDYSNCCSICLPLPPISPPGHCPPNLSNLPSANFPQVFSCNYTKTCVTGFHGELLRQTSKCLMGEGLVDFRDLKVASSFDLWLVFMFDNTGYHGWTEATAGFCPVSLPPRRSFEPHSASNLTDMKPVPVPLCAPTLMTLEFLSNWIVGDVKNMTVQGKRCEIARSRRSSFMWLIRNMQENDVQVCSHEWKLQSLLSVFHNSAFHYWSMTTVLRIWGSFLNI